MGNTANKRIYERYNPSGMAIWVRKKGTPEEDSTPVDIKNISAGGANCLFRHSFEIGTLLEIDFELPQYTEIIKATAKVHREDGKEEGYFLTGIEFLEVINLDRQVLFNFLEEVLK